MDKRILVTQLTESLRESLRVSRSAYQESASEVHRASQAGEKGEGAAVVIENRNLARAQARRATEAMDALRILEGYVPPAFRVQDRIRVGALVEVEDEDTAEGRTFVLLPAGAGTTLSGPGGDGLFSVVTPASPIGKAVMGRRKGDVVDVTVRGEVREWAITYVE